MNFKVDISVCRVCMKSENGISLLKDAALLDKFVYTTKLKVKADDCMPAILCEKCIARLKIAHEFCRLANLSENYLRKFISKINLDFREVTKTLPNDDDQEEYDEVLDEFDPMEPEEIIAGPPPEPVPPSPEAAPHSPPPSPQPKPQLQSQSVVTTNQKRKLKVEAPEIVNSEIELMVDEPQQEDNIVIGKVETLTNEIQMEEFHEIIQDDECDANLYLDENTYEELQLYEADDGEIYENQGTQQIEEGETDGEIIAADHIENYSGAEGGEEYSLFIESQDEKSHKPTRSNRKYKRTSGESAASKIEGKSNICIKCNKDFSTKTNLMRHMSTHDGVKPYRCHHCGKGFTQNGSLKQHIFIHTGEKPHVCHVCQRGFTQSKSLIFHMRRHTGEKPFNCEECGINFRQKDGLKQHIHKYHAEGPAKREAHICPVCERVLSSKYSLSMHVKKHQSKPEEQDGEILNRCFEGGTFEKSTTTTTTTTAKQVKSESQQYLSPTAGAEYTEGSAQMIDLQDQIEQKPTISHAGAGVRMKQFQCGKCFKSFHIKRNLLRHLRNHDVSTLELHECTDCGIGFDTKRSLKLHRQRDHKDVICDLNNCEYCDAPFVSVADLSEHIANEHDAIDQICPHCNDHFNSQKLYYDHLLEHEHMLDN